MIHRAGVLHLGALRFHARRRGKQLKITAGHRQDHQLPRIPGRQERRILQILGHLEISSQHWIPNRVTEIALGLRIAEWADY